MPLEPQWVIFICAPQARQHIHTRLDSVICLAGLLHAFYALEVIISHYIPALLQNFVLQWYHTTLQHPGIKRMQATMRENVPWAGLDAVAEHAV
jgi:hypothetical protein